MKITRQTIIDRALEKFKDNDIGKAKQLLNILEKANEGKEVKDIFTTEELELVSMHYYLDGIWTKVAPVFWFQYGNWEGFCKDILEIEPNEDLVEQRVITSDDFPHFEAPKETIQDILK